MAAFRDLLLGVAPLALLANSVGAQTASVAAPVADPQDGQQAADAQNDIVVVGTAGGGTRRQQAAFAVTSLNAEAIERIAPATTADLLRTIPGVAAESSGGQNGANIFVRGYPSGGDAQFVTFESAGVPVFPPPTLSFLENSQLIQLDDTVERVEAVRGGTGSLFSNGQPGLTVNVVQREGGDVLHGNARASFTDYGEVRGDAWVSGPLGNNTGFMVGGFYAQSHGVRDPQFRADQGGQITANIRHDFGGNGSVLVYARYLDDHGQWLLPIPVVQNGRNLSSYPGFDAGTGTLESREVRVTTRNDGRQVDLADGRGAKVINTGINFDHDLVDGLKLRERAAYLGGTADTVGLVPGGPPVTAAAYAASLGGAIGSLTYVSGGGAASPNQPVMLGGVWEVRKRISSFVNDLSLEFRRGGNTLTGGFYYANYTARDRWDLGNNLLLTAQSNARRLNLTLADGRITTRDGFTSGSGYALQASYTGTDYAGYAVDEFQVTPKLRVDGGARWQRHEIDGTVRNPVSINRDGNPNTLYDNADSVPGSTYTQVNYRKSRWSFTAGANYDLTSELGAFARFSRGYGFPQFDDLRSGITIDARVDTYEGGVKVSTQPLNVYATVFHNKFEGLSNATQTGSGGQIVSVGGARATGVELEGVVRPVRPFSVAFSGTYLDAKYRNYLTSGGTGVINDDGNRVQRQPRWSWRVTPALDLDVGGFRPSVYATLIYTGDRFSDPENQQVLPRFYQLDAGVSLTVARRVKLLVTGNNLTNTIGLTEGNPRALGSQGAGVILARPILGRSFRFSAAVGF